jgi:thioredoxin-related protein
MRTLIFIFFLSYFPLSVKASGIEFFNGSFAEAQKKAKAENKKIFVDFYAVWCGPCKYMASTVFPNDSVGKYFNTHFICLKVDAEKKEKELCDRMNIQAYPTLGFFSSDGKLIFQTVGALDASGLMNAAQEVVNFEANKKAYEKDRNNIKAMTNYCLILRHSDPEKAYTIVSKYLYEIPTEGMMQKENWSLIFTFENGPDTRFFDHGVRQFKTCLDSLLGFTEYYQRGIDVWMRRAVEQCDTSWLNRSKEYNAIAMKSMGVAEDASTKFSFDIFYYAETGQMEKHLFYMDQWIMLYVSDQETIGENCSEAMERYGTPAFEYCKRWAEKGMQIEINAYSLLTMSIVYKLGGMKGDALDYAERALKKAGPNDDKEYINEFIKEIKAMK